MATNPNERTKGINKKYMTGIASGVAIITYIFCESGIIGT